MTRDELKKYLLETLPENPHGRLLLSPRSGKTRIVIELIKRDKPNSILWVSPSRKLIDEDIPAEFKKWKALTYLKKLTTVTYASLSNIKGFYEWIILDEEQFITEANSINLLNNELKYNNIISMTGKGSLSILKKEIYKKLNLNILHKLDIKKSKGTIVSNYNINIIDVSLSDEYNIIVKRKDKKTFNTTERKQYEYLSKAADNSIALHEPNSFYKVLARMRAIYNSKSKERKLIELLNEIKDQRNMIFCSSIDQAERLGNGNTYHSKTNKDALKKFINHEIKELYLVNAGGVGFTYNKIDNLIIVQANSDTNGLTTQKISRTLLLQKNYIANIYILRLLETKDEIWVEKLLKDLI